MNGKKDHRIMSCAAARGQLALLLYGELSFDEEEHLEAHLEKCPECRAALQREKNVHAAFDGAATEPAASLLQDCRTDLRARLALESEIPQAAREDGGEGWWARLAGHFTGTGASLNTRTGLHMILRPATAVALVAVGFVGARLTSFPTVEAPGEAHLNSTPGVVQAASRVRDVQPGANGRVQIVVDTTQQQTVSGSVDDQRIRSLLLQAAKDPNDPGVRAESVDLLNSRAESPDVRETLVYALRHDQNAGVRLKAMDGLKQYVTQPDVRSALSQALLSDSNPGVRTQAIDLLAQEPGSMFDRQTIGVLQELMLREDNAYVRQRCQRVLTSLNASPEIY
jgi:anti-sigma factor RsiW